MAIPKIIHYVWVGGQEKPKNIRLCMKSWQKHLKDYKIIEWNESNFDINSNRFVKQAYERKKWAYVSDYIRAYAIYNYGGIYLDTDVIVMDNLEKFLSNKAFVGFENPQYPFTAVFGAEKGHPFIKDMLDYYNDIDFEYDSNDEMAKVNTKSVSDILIEKYNCQVNNQEQLLKTGIHVYPDNILCNPSMQSSTIHIFTGTWMETKSEFKRKFVTFLKVHISNRFTTRLYLFFKKFF